MHRRIESLIFTVFVIVFSVFGNSMAMQTRQEAEGTRLKQLKTLRTERKKLAHRKRRMIFNNDGCDNVYECEEATRESFLKCRMTDLLGTQVDTVFYCTNGPFDLFWHNTKVGEIFTCKQGPFSKNKTADFIEQDTDCLEMIVDFCRKNNIEVFWSMRMNDIHDVWNTPGAPYLFSKFKTDHPEYLMGTKENIPKFGAWTALDYGQPEVRQKVFQAIKEVCENYDIDGIELDFFRDPLFFRAQADGNDVGQKELDIMTELLRRIRNMTEDVGLKRGRPILVAIRTTDSVGYDKAVGLDTVGWMKESLIDMQAVSGFFRLNPWQVSVKTAHKYGIPVYPCLSDTWMREEYGQIRRSIESYRARAMNAWGAGADGIYIFNYFDSNGPVWRELGDHSALETMDKVYTTGARQLKKMTLNNAQRFVNRKLVCPYDHGTWPLKPGEPVEVDLVVGQSVRERPDLGLRPEAKLRILVKKVQKADELSVKINDKLLYKGIMTGEKLEGGEWIEYEVDPKFLTKGSNKFKITLSPESKAEKPRLKDFLLRVNYHSLKTG